MWKRETDQCDFGANTSPKTLIWQTDGPVAMRIFNIHNHGPHTLTVSVDFIGPIAIAKGDTVNVPIKTDNKGIFSSTGVSAGWFKMVGG